MLENQPAQKPKLHHEPSIPPRFREKYSLRGVEGIAAALPDTIGPLAKMRMFRNLPK
jgi:hypothetical protein